MQVVSGEKRNQFVGDFQSSFRLRQTNDTRGETLLRENS